MATKNTAGSETMTAAQMRNLARLKELGGTVYYDWCRGFRQDGQRVKGLHSKALNTLVSLGLVVSAVHSETVTRKERQQEWRGRALVTVGWETRDYDVSVFKYCLA